MRQVLFPANISHHISAYEGDDALEFSGWVGSDHFVQAFVRENGYFAAVLPPGRYYFVEIGFDSMPEHPGVLFVRTYTPMKAAGFSTRPKRHFVITFDVVAGEATYVGTMRHQTTRTAGNTYNELRASWGMDLLDESPTAHAWLRTKYPGLTNVVTRLAQEHELQ